MTRAPADNHGSPVDLLPALRPAGPRHPVTACQAGGRGLLSAGDGGRPAAAPGGLGWVGRTGPPTNPQRCRVTLSLERAGRAGEGCPRGLPGGRRSPALLHLPRNCTAHPAERCTNTHSPPPATATRGAAGSGLLHNSE